MHADQISTVWAILSSILQIGNMCFSSYEVCVCGKEAEKQTFPMLLTFVCAPLSPSLPGQPIQSESFEVARIFSEAEARRVGCLLQISSEALQTVITHRVTVSSSASHLNSKTERQMISSLRRPSMTGYTAPCLLKVPLNPGKKTLFSFVNFCIEGVC